MKSISQSLILACFLFLSACSKNDDVVPSPATNTQVNQNNFTPDTLHGTDFVEFQIDGVQYAFNNYSYVEGPHMPISSVSSDSNSNGQSYSISGLFANDLSSAKNVMQIVVRDTMPVSTKLYSLSAQDIGYRQFLFFFHIKNNKAYSNSSLISEIEFTRIDNWKGGKIEGTFSLPNLALMGSSGTIYTTDHVLTNGKFSLTIKD